MDLCRIFIFLLFWDRMAFETFKKILMKFQISGSNGPWKILREIHGMIGLRDLQKLFLKNYHRTLKNKTERSSKYIPKNPHCRVLKTLKNNLANPLEDPQKYSVKLIKGPEKHFFHNSPLIGFIFSPFSFFLKRM